MTNFFARVIMQSRRGANLLSLPAPSAKPKQHARKNSAKRGCQGSRSDRPKKFLCELVLSISVYKKTAPEVARCVSEKTVCALSALCVLPPPRRPFTQTRAAERAEPAARVWNGGTPPLSNTVVFVTRQDHVRAQCVAANSDFKNVCEWQGFVHLTK